MGFSEANGLSERAPSKRSLYAVPAPSNSFTREAYLDQSVAPVAIRFTYPVNGNLRDGGIKFTRVAAVRMRAERCCQASHIDGAYDTLVEIDNSDWTAEIRKDTQEQWRDKGEMHHYMIYLDSVGCFELIAESWAPF